MLADPARVVTRAEVTFAPWAIVSPVLRNNYDEMFRQDGIKGPSKFYDTIYFRLSN